MNSQDFAGNSFASTVAQAVLMTSLTCAPAGWDDLSPAEGDGGKVHAQEVSRSSSTTGGGTGEPIMRRLRRKRKAPEYDQMVAATDTNLVGDQSEGKEQKKGRRKKGPYKRKVPGQDSRRNGTGKKPSATIWQKEQVWGS